MSIFSILSTARRAVDAGTRLQNAQGISQAVGAVRDFIPDEIINEAARATGKVGAFRNVLDLGPNVPQNPKPQFDINRFTSELGRTGMVANNRFTVEIFPPEAIVTDKIHDSLKLRCFASSLPGKQLMLKDDIRRHGYGKIDKVPHNTMYGDVTLSFIIDAYGDVPVLFQRWMSYINTASSIESDLDQPIDGERPTVDYLINYKENYAGPMVIRQMTSIYDNVYGVELNQAYPIAIGDQQLAWDQNNSLAILPVTFTYLDYKLA